jgi:hypothetical protein
MKPKLKPPGTKRLKLEYDGLLSNLGFKFNLRRYNLEQQCAKLAMSVAKEGERQGLTIVHFSAQVEPFLTQNAPQPPLDTP